MTQIPEKCNDCGSSNIIECDPLVAEHDSMIDPIVVEWGFECYDCGNMDFETMSKTYYKKT